MDTGQQRDMLQMLKALSDNHRLIMVRLMSGSERTVTEMAAALELTEPTVSHHVSRLHEAGFLRLRMAGNQRFYQTNSTRLDQFRAYAAQLDMPIAEVEPFVPDTAWIDALDWPAEDKKVLRDHTRDGKIIKFPQKDKKWIVLLRWLATRFQPDTRYSEKQMNAILKEFHPDYAQMRRDLVDFGFMRRERGGGDYWLTPEDEKQP